MYGSYSESLKTGGTLSITNKGWEIYYYFPGPDRRYKGSSKTIPGEYIDKYIEAWKANFNEFLSLKETSQEEGFQYKYGELGMIIQTGTYSGFDDGVSLCHNSKRVIHTKEELDAVIADYEYAKKKASEYTEVVKDLVENNHYTTTDKEESNIDDTILNYFSNGGKDILQFCKDNDIAIAELMDCLSRLKELTLLSDFHLHLEWNYPLNSLQEMYKSITE